MANRKSLYDLAEVGDRVEIEGKLEFSALRKKAKPTKPTDFDFEPAYRITIMDPKVVKGQDTELGKHVLDDAQDVTHGSYMSDKGKNAGHRKWSYVTSPNAKYAPEIYSKKTGSDHVPAPDILDNELAAGQTVGVLFSVYQTKRKNGQTVKGGSFDGVVIEDAENIKYFTAGSNYSDFFDDDQAEKPNKLSEIVAKKKANKPAASETKEQEPEDSDEESDDAAISKEADDLFSDN